jgi:hypothetical protein
LFETFSGICKIVVAFGLGTSNNFVLNLQRNFLHDQ